MFNILITAPNDKLAFISIDKERSFVEDTLLMIKNGFCISDDNYEYLGEDVFKIKCFTTATAEMLLAYFTKFSV